MFRPSASRSARAALEWLGEDAGLARLAAAAKRLAELQQEVDRIMAPMTLQVIALDQGRLLLGAAHAAAAARLRQREPSLVRHLVARGWPVSEVRFRPPRAPDAPPALPARPKAIPQAAAVAALGRLAGQVRHPELSKALHRFARRHGAT
ncbi:MAG: DciA family protein [Burkholderiaceae bacterium]